jgi:hypothetical protein
MSHDFSRPPLQRCRDCGALVVVHASKRAGGPGCPSCGANNWAAYRPPCWEEQQEGYDASISGTSRDKPSAEENAQ